MYAHDLEICDVLAEVCVRMADRNRRGVDLKNRRSVPSKQRRHEGAMCFGRVQTIYCRPGQSAG